MSAPEADGISAGQALVGTALEPWKTFGRLVKAPTWWLPTVLWLAAVLASTWLATPKIDLDRSIRDILDKRGLPEERVQEILARADRSQSSNALKGTAGLAVAYVLSALVLWGSARAFGSEARFTQVLAVFSHANMANVAGVLFAIPLLLQLPDASITQRQIGRYVKSNLGAFLPESLGPFLLSLAGSIDVFTIGTVALLCVGLRRLPELGPGSATAIPLTLWLLYALGKASLAALLF